MKILTRYLFREILHYFLLFTAMFVVILLVYEVYDKRDYFVEFSPPPPLLVVVRFMAYSIPPKLVLVLPMIGMMATMFAYGLLAKNREILAMVAAGISFRQLAKPAILFGVGLSLFMLYFNESVVPISKSKSLYIEKVEIRGKSETIFTKSDNVFIKGAGHRFYFIENYLANQRTMIFPTLFELYEDGIGLACRIEADRGELVESGEGEGRVWEFTGAQVWKFDRNGTLVDWQRYDTPQRYPMEEKLDKFLTKSKEPEEMSYLELREYCSLLARQGSDQVDAYQVSLYQKLTFPITCLLMALLGFAAVVDMHARHFARGFVVGVALSVGFYLLHGFLADLGNRGLLPAVLAGWLPVIIFTAVVLAVYRQLHRIRG